MGLHLAKTRKKRYENNREKRYNNNRYYENNWEKCYDPRDSSLKFVDREDDLDFLCEGFKSRRALMSCGHAVTPTSLTNWCRQLLDEGKSRFVCGLYGCDVEWTYDEVRKMALLTPEETAYFEKAMASNAMSGYCVVKQCPRCKTSLEREDLTDLSVQCTVCTADKKTVYQFCWQCLKPWKGKAPRSDRCDNPGCIDHVLDILKNCKDTTLPQVKGVNKCPSIRACPTCGQRVEHDRSGCKNVTCPRCQKEFCFMCLKLTPVCLETSSYFTACRDGVAPRQTSIPVWHRN